MVGNNMEKCQASVPKEILWFVATISLTLQAREVMASSACAEPVTHNLHEDHRDKACQKPSRSQLHENFCFHRRWSWRCVIQAIKNQQGANEPAPSHQTQNCLSGPPAVPSCVRSRRCQRQTNNPFSKLVASKVLN